MVRTREYTDERLADDLALADDEAWWDLATSGLWTPAERRYLEGLRDVPDPLSDGLGCDHEPHRVGRATRALGYCRRSSLAQRVRGVRREAAEVAPMATWKPFSGKSTTALTHDIVCLHSMVGTLAGSWNYANGQGNPYWHFGLAGNGTLWQCQDLRYRSAANLEGNWHVIPIETADTNEGIWPSPWKGNVAWTQAQLDKLVQLIAWLCKRYAIPPVLVPDTCKGRRGIAYHRQGIVGNYPPGTGGLVAGCEKWSSSNGKTCPQDPRIAQLKNYIIPRVQALVNPPKEWDEMATKEEIKALVTDVVKTYTSAWLVRPKMPDGTISPHVFVVSHDFSSKQWWGDWAVINTLDFVENLNDAGTVSGHPAPHNFDWRFIGQIHEVWNPQFGLSYMPLPESERWKNTPAPWEKAGEVQPPPPPS